MNYIKLFRFGIKILNFICVILIIANIDRAIIIYIVIYFSKNICIINTININNYFLYPYMNYSCELIFILFYNILVF